MFDDRSGGANDRGGYRRGMGGGGGSSAPRGGGRGDGGARNADVKPQVHLGSFKWLDFEKGYGFITPDAKGKSDMFAHISCLDPRLLSTLRESFASGENLSIHRVRYQVATPKVVPGVSVGRNADKPFAVNVALASDDDQGLGEEEAVDDMMENGGGDDTAA